MTVWLEIESDERAEQAFTMVVDAFEQAEQRMSRFRVASELSWLNTQSNRWAQLSPPMWNVIAKAFVLSAETGGLFDPTVHDALIAAGYERSFDDLNGHAASATIAVSLSERASVQLDPEQQAIYLPEGVRLDLGGIGKGFTAQTVVEWLSEWGPCLIDAGGDLTAGDAPSGLSGWPVGIAAPWTHEMPEQENMMRLWLANSSLATSGVDYRRWQHGDVVLHHVIDPRIGISAETDLSTCSVLAADACRAEAWATATLVAGAELGYSRLVEQQLAGVTISQTGETMLTPALQPHVQLECGQRLL